MIFSTAFAEIAGDALITIIGEEDTVRAEWAYYILCYITFLTEAQHTQLVGYIDEAEWARCTHCYATNLTEGDINTLRNVEASVA